MSYNFSNNKVNNSTGQCKAGSTFVLLLAMFLLPEFPGNLTMLIPAHVKKSFSLTTFPSRHIDSGIYIACFLVGLPAAYFMKESGYKARIINELSLFSAGAFLPVTGADDSKDHYRPASGLYSLFRSNQISTGGMRKFFCGSKNVLAWPGNMSPGREIKLRGRDNL